MIENIRMREKKRSCGNDKGKWPWGRQSRWQDQVKCDVEIRDDSGWPMWEDSCSILKPINCEKYKQKYFSLNRPIWIVCNVILVNKLIPSEPSRARLLTALTITDSYVTTLHVYFFSVALQPRRAKTDWSGCCQMTVQGPCG